MLRYLGILCVYIAILIPIGGCNRTDSINAAEAAVASAKTSADEKKAFTSINQYTSGYKVLFFDESGKQILPQHEKSYEHVATIKIAWPNGQTVTSGVIDPKNLTILVRE